MSAAVVFANVFLGAYLLDGALSVLDGSLRLAGVALLATPRDWLATGVLLAAPIQLLVTLCSSRLPKRVLLPLGLAALWLNFGAPPLGGAFADSPRGDLALSLVQCACAAPALVWVRRRSGGTAWFFESRFLPAGRPRRTLLVVAIVLGLPVVAGLLLLASGVYLAERATGGFVGFTANGITFDERHYRRGDREVRLIGMSHVGQKGVYAALLEQPDDTPTLILEEGVSDTQGLLPRIHFQEPLALALGLDAQPPVAEMLGDAPDAEEQDGAAATPAIENADVDVSTFRPSTLEFLRIGLRLNAAPADAEVRRELEALVARHAPRALYGGLREDLLDMRNEHVLERIDAGLEDHARVLVPWGALHLAGIEAGLLARGFELASREPRSFLPYSAIVTLLGRLREP